mgnify:CR=1 FL=1
MCVVYFRSFVICLFEFVAWIWDPFRVHQMLNDGEEMEWRSKLLAGCINSGFLFWLAYALFRRHSKSVLILFGFFQLFTFMQWNFWWIPYFTGYCNSHCQEHIIQLSQAPRLLPQSDLYLVPDIEHTILQVLSFPTLLGLNLAIAKMQAISFQSKAKYAILASLMFCVFPLLFVLFDTLENSLGACFVIVAIILNTSATLLYCKITSSTTKAS